jgi:hypothetical protein
MLGDRFPGLVLVGAKSYALPIRKHEPLMMANFRDDVFGRSETNGHAKFGAALNRAVLRRGLFAICATCNARLGRPQ